MATDLPERLRLWLMFNEGYGNLAVFLAAAVIMSGGLLLAMLPSGPSRQVSGTVVRQAGMDSKYGYRPWTEVRLATGLTVDIPMPRQHACRIGDAVVVEFSPRIWGVVARPKRIGCAA